MGARSCWPAARRPPARRRSSNSRKAPPSTRPVTSTWRTDSAARRVVVSGLIVAGMDVGPGGRLFVADRHAGRIIAVGADGTLIEVATFGEGDTPRALAWPPVTEATRRAGIAGDLFVVVTRRGVWSLNEIVRISGPFDDLVRNGTPAR